jgi:hypothetical protein
MGDRARGELQHAAAIDLIDQVEGAVYSLTSASAKTISALIQALIRQVPALEEEITKAHAQVARDAQRAILDAYDDSLLHTPPYRQNALLEKNRRYAGGMLRSVLASEDFVTSDSRGIYIGNTAELDARARQWRRLNYGAGSDAGGGAQIFTLRWSNQQFFLEEPGGVRPPFRIPAGSWFGEEFYPTSEREAQNQYVSRVTGRKIRSLRGWHTKAFGLESNDVRRQKARMTRGIRGRHWLGAGIGLIAEDLPEAYSAAVNKLFKAGDQAMQDAVHEAGATRPGQPKATVTVTQKA